MALIATALTTPDKLRLYVDQHRTEGTDGNLSDDDMELFINAISQRVASYLQRLVAVESLQVVCEATPGDPTVRVYAAPRGPYPVRTLATLTLCREDGSQEEVAARAEVGGTGWWQSPLDARRGLVRQNQVTPREGDTWLLEGEFGIVRLVDGAVVVPDPEDTEATPEPADAVAAHQEIEHAVLVWCAHAMTSRVPDEASVTVDGMQRSVRDLPIPTRCKAILEPYRYLAI